MGEGGKGRKLGVSRLKQSTIDQFDCFLLAGVLFSLSFKDRLRLDQLYYIPQYLGRHFWCRTNSHGPLLAFQRIERASWCLGLGLFMVKLAASPDFPRSQPSLWLWGL